MKAKILIFVVSLAASISVAAQNYVTLYTDCYYRGQLQTFAPGRYYLNQSRVGASNVSSLRVPNGMKVVFYTGDQPGTGDKTRYEYDVMCLSTFGWNDRAVTMVVEGSYYNGNNYNNNGYHNNNGYNYNNGYNNNYDYNNNYNNNNNRYDKTIAFTTCLDARYGGERRQYTVGAYNLDGDVMDRSISSFYVAAGYRVIVYDQLYRRGNSRIYTENDLNLNNTGWNDRIRSFVIERR